MSMKLEFKASSCLNLVLCFGVSLKKKCTFADSKPPFYTIRFANGLYASAYSFNVSINVD